jgi:hypothetical protein
MRASGDPGRISRKERAARDALGMPAGHPEMVTRKPGRAEWKQLTARLAEMWPNDEYRASSPTDGARTSRDRNKRQEVTP